METSFNDCKCEAISELKTRLPTEEEIGDDEELREYVKGIRQRFGELAERGQMIQAGEKMYWGKHPIKRWWHNFAVKHFGTDDYSATARLEGMLHANRAEGAKALRGGDTHIDVNETRIDDY